MARSPVGNSRCDICNIVKIKRMARLWRKLTGGGSARSTPPSDVPPGHVAVLIGKGCKRFIIKADYLNHPIFHQLLEQASEEYGLKHDGPLAIPCDEFVFRDIIFSLEHGTEGSQFTCHYVEMLDWRNSTPLLQGFERRSMC